MRAKIFFITLAVDDLGRSVAFYRDGLGWPAEGHAERAHVGGCGYVAASGLGLCE